MNRQEAIIVMRDTNWSRMRVDWSYADRRRVLDAIMVSLAALRVPEPDPEPLDIVQTLNVWNAAMDWKGGAE